MKPYRLRKGVAPAGYLQFWKDHPPVLIVHQLPRPRVPRRLITDVHPPGPRIEFVSGSGIPAPSG